MNEERFWGNVDKSGGPDACWPWMGYVNKGGYGTYGISHNGRAKAHRLAWELKHGPIPDGLDVLHSCDNPPCCNDQHHFLGTNVDNSHDCVNKGRQAKGERHGMHKLTPSLVAEIRTRYSRGDISQTALGAEYGICRQEVGHIVNNRRWQEVAHGR